MHIIFFHAFTDCRPTLTPPGGSKDYVNDGSNVYDLTWNYNTDGRTIKEVQLKYAGAGNVDITVAGITSHDTTSSQPIKWLLS